MKRTILSKNNNLNTVGARDIVDYGLFGAQFSIRTGAEQFVCHQVRIIVGHGEKDNRHVD